MRRKFFSILTALALCLGLLPGTARAVGETLEDKSGGWIELLAVNLPTEETVYTAGGGTITWTPSLNADGVPVNGTVTLNNATIIAEKGGIILPVPFTLALKGSSTITTQTAGPVAPEGVECAIVSRLTSLTITGPGSLTINSAGRAIEAFGELTIQDGATVTVNTTGGDHAVYSGNIKTDDINIERGNITIEDSTLFITADSTNPPLFANMGKLSIKNSHVFVKSAKEGTQDGVAAISGQSVLMKDSDVAAIGSESQPGVGVIRFGISEGNFVMDGGILYVENTGSGGYDFDYSDTYATANNNAVICYKGNLYYMIVNGDNIQYAGCTYDESSHNVTSVQHGYVGGDLTWNEKMPAPQNYFVYLYMMRYTDSWNYIPATLTIPTGTEAEIPAIGLSQPGCKIINNGTLTSVIGIRNFGTIEGTGKLNASVQTRETVGTSSNKDIFTAHGNATFWESFTKIGTTVNNGVTTQNIIDIPAGTSLTIPQGATLDATAGGTITAQILADYYTNNGTLVVNGTVKFPAGTDFSSLGTVTGSGQVMIGDRTTYPVTVTGGTADKSLAAEGETVTLIPEEETGKAFKSWTVTAGGVTVGENNTFTMPSQAVAVTAQYAYTVTFDSQGGSAVESQSVEGGVRATAPADPARTGHTFGGWYTDAAGTSVYDFNSAVTSPLTLYAKWMPIKYTVTFDAQDGSEPSPVQADYGTKLSRPVDPIREGYTFGGWYKEVTCATAWDFETDTVTSSTTLYAKWLQISVESVTLNKTSLTLTEGGSERLTAAVTPGDATDKSVTWASSNTAVATVDANGTITAVSAGTATITVTTADGGKTASCTVTVTAPAIHVTGITLDKTSLTLTEGGSERLTAAVTPGDATDKSVTWASSNTAVATVDANGTITAVSAGTATITVTTAGGGKTASCTVTVTARPSETETKLEIGEGITEVPEGLKSIPELDTPAKLDAAMRTAITQAGVPSENTAVYDVMLLVSQDGGQTWTAATKENFPTGGLTITLPYPAGTDSGCTFTVVHMFTTSDFGKVPGNTETPRVTNTASGLQFTVTGLSPISVGWVKPSTPTEPDDGGENGGWSSSTYAVTVEKSEHGKVASNRTNANSGSTVTLTVTPDSGYVLDALTVTDSRGNAIRLTAQGDGKYTFTMPGRAVTVKAAFAPLPDDKPKPCDGGADCPSRGFTDLGTVGTWYHEAVDYVLRNDLMDGYGNGEFGPNDNLTRAQFAQILFHMEGRPAVNYLLRYNDVADGAWYTEAIRWATSQGIVGGYGNGMFGPNDNITREQLAVMLWRYTGSPAATEKELRFTDADEASGYALEALRWAVENGILNGYGDGRLDPKGQVTRAQAAQMLSCIPNM